MRTTAAALALALLRGVWAQDGGIGRPPAAGGCAMQTVYAWIGTLDAQCCDSSAVKQCTIECSSTLFPLLDDCRPLLDVLLDMDDGTRDGVAGQLDDLHDQCLAIPEQDVLARLKEMHIS